MYLASWLLGLLSGCVFAVALVYSGVVAIPSRFNPWAPLVLAEPPNLLTRYKLERLEHDRAQCISILSEAEMRFTPVPDRQTGEGCGFTNAVRVEATTARLRESFMLSCHSAVALALWERHVVQPAAMRHFGDWVARLEHFGSYACRNVYGRADDRRSQHATADALDVAGFVTTKGLAIRVRSDWRDTSAAAAFLHEVRTGACGLFDAVLGPDYNAGHSDHLHLDRGSFRVCR